MQARFCWLQQECCSTELSVAVLRKMRAASCSELRKPASNSWRHIGVQGPSALATTSSSRGLAAVLHQRGSCA